MYKKGGGMSEDREYFEPYTADGVPLLSSPFYQWWFRETYVASKYWQGVQGEQPWKVGEQTDFREGWDYGWKEIEKKLRRVS